MRYPGGKGKCFQHVINLMPPHRVYVETHLGGGAVLRNKRPAQVEIAIERDPHVVARWRACAVRPELQLIEGRAEDFLATYAFIGDELVYVDPPYVPGTRKRQRVYAHDYAVEDHERLLALLVTLPCRVILSGYACDLYAQALRNWNRRDFQAKTHAGVRTESLWFNFEPPSVLHDARYLGDNFREREVTKRRVQRLQDRLARVSEAERAVIARWLRESYPEASRSHP